MPRSANNPLSTIALGSRWSVRRFAPEELLLHRRAVVLGELLPLPGLGGEHEVHDVARQEAERAVVVLGAPLAVVARRRVAPGGGASRTPVAYPARASGPCWSSAHSIASSKERSEISGLMALPFPRSGELNNARGYSALPGEV